MMEKLASLTAQAVNELYSQDVTCEFTRPDEAHGDFATNVALKVSASVGKPPREVATAIVEKLGQLDSSIKLEIAGPGFINVRLQDEDIFASALIATKLEQASKDQKVVAEYSDPNPFKILHAGHIYTTVVGDVIANLFEESGGIVHRVNFGGDVGLHVGKTMWAILEEFGGENPEKLKSIDTKNRSQWLASCYIKGTTAYDDNPKAKDEIVILNKKIYGLHTDDDHKSPLAQIYWTCRQWSYGSFDAFYARMGTKLDKYYPESEVSDLGLQTVKQHIGDVFEESEGAVIFKGEKHGLHTRVFVNREGLPTYEAKDVGLIIKKDQDYHFDRSVVVTGNEQQQYMQVVLKAIEQFLPDLASKTTYVPHGMVRLVGGVKMSSRKGNIVTADDVIDETAEANKLAGNQDDSLVVLGAIKYAFLRVRIGGDIVYDPKESVSLEGNSGPYLQYALVRARSILSKAKAVKSVQDANELDPAERSLARKIGMYPEAFSEALTDYSPHHICTYLFELAQTFNRFYEKSRVIGDPRASERKALVEAYEKVLSHGLGVLGIPKPEKM